MPPSSNSARHCAYRMRQDLDRCMVSRDSYTRCFVPQISIDICWPEDLKLLREKLGLHSWTGQRGKDLLDILRKECRIVTSVLVWIEDYEFAERLEVLCSNISDTQHRSQFILRDSHLALDRTKCEEIFGPHAGRSFYQDQFIFTPIAIRTAPEVVQKVHPDSRWPWESSTKEVIGSGAYGTVYKVKIAKGQLEPTQDSYGDKDGFVAYKSVRKPTDWIREVENLDFLKGSLSKHERLTLHYAALVQDRDFYIFLPYTHLGDLEAFLKEGVRLDDASTDVTFYDFASEFNKFEALNLAQEFVCIISATAYLHDRVSSVRGTLVYCVHADLRPQNILVFPGDAQNPVGVWRISDFGISSFKLENDRTPDGSAWAMYPSVGDVFEERWKSSMTLSTVPRPPGTYVGPERQLEDLDRLKENDVWSLGCIFAEVLVFGLGTNQRGSRKRWLDDFRRERRKTQGLGLDRNDYFYDFEPTEIPVGVDTEISFKRRDKVDEWLMYLFMHSSLYRDLAVVVHQMLQPDPSLRDNAGSAYDLALRVCNHHFTTVSSLQEDSGAMIEDFEVSMLRAEPWRVWNFRHRNEDAREVLTPQTRPQDPNGPFTFQSAQTIEARVTQPRFLSGNDNSLTREAWKVKISDSCGVAVYLCKRPKSCRSSFSWLRSTSSSKFVYELRFRRPWQQSDDLKAEDTSTHPLPECGSVKWLDLYVNGQSAIVIGTHLRSRSKRTYIYDFVKGSKITLPRDASAERMHKFLTSAQGSFVAYDDKAFALWQPCGSYFTQEISPPFGASGQAVLGHTGGFLFTWSCRHEQDILKIWKTEPSDEPQVCATRFISRPGDHAPREMLLIPCGLLPACIIRDGRGTWYTASSQPDVDTEDRDAAQQQPLGTDLPAKRSLYAANERYLFFVAQNQDICACNLLWSDSATLTLDRWPDALTKTKVRHPESIALYEKEGGTYDLVISDLSGAMESIEIEC